MGCRGIFRLTGRKTVAIFWFCLPQCEVVPEHHHLHICFPQPTSILTQTTSDSWCLILKFPSCSLTHGNIQEYLWRLSAILCYAMKDRGLAPSFKSNKQAEIRCMQVRNSHKVLVQWSPLVFSDSHYTSIVAYLFVVPVKVDIISGVVAHVPNIVLNNTRTQIHSLLPKASWIILHSLWIQPLAG